MAEQTRRRRHNSTRVLLLSRYGVDNCFRSTAWAIIGLNGSEMRRSVHGEETEMLKRR